MCCILDHILQRAVRSSLLAVSNTEVALIKSARMKI